MVLGGGLSGVIHAFVLARSGARVTVIESGKELAAGWHGCGPDGALDAGLRIPARSGLAWVDRIVFEDTAALVGGESWWHALPCPVSEGHAVNDCVRDSALQRARAEAIARSELEDPGASAGSLADRLRAIFGETLSSEVFAPAVRAVIGDPPEALS